MTKFTFKHLLYFFVCLILIQACAVQKTTAPINIIDVQCIWGSAKIDICEYDSKEAIINAFIEEMTLDEKIGQMTQSVWHNSVSPEIIQDRKIGSIIHTEGPTPGPKVSDWTTTFDTFQTHALKTRLGIPLLIAVDAIHGQNTFEGAVIFPHNLGMGATRNYDLIRRAAEITAIETAGTGFNWTFSPVIAMPEHEHWGRVYEGFSEDANITTKALIASIQGHQGADLAQRDTIAATAKHYLGDGATQGGIEGGNAIIDEQALRERFLPPYQAAVNQGIASIMVGFNSVNGTNMHQNEYLVQDVLKGQLGFDGVVVTDWLGGTRWGEPYTVINAGIDIAMQPANHDEFMAKLKATVLDGAVSMARIDDAVRRILGLKFDLGLFRDPFAKKELSALVGSTQHREVARQAVRESLVLLKSEANVLPLKSTDKIAVIGKHANNSGLQSGGWSIHWQGQNHSYAGATTILDGIHRFAPEAQYHPTGCTEDMQASKVVAVVGELPYAEFKGDSTNLNLTETQKKMLSQCKNLGKQVIVVLISGRAMTVTDTIEQSDAFIAAWLPGSEGAGLADFLFGANGFKPLGKLPTSWPDQYEDLPLAPDAKNALYPIGFGLNEY
ncbi:MAG: beta-glucosidase [Glaciecola sp.]